MVVDGFPVAFAGIRDRADNIDIGFVSALQLKIAGIFAEDCGQVSGIRARHYEIHRADIAGTLFYDTHAALDRFEHVIFIESLYVVEYFFRADPPFLADPDTLKLAVEDEHMPAVEEGHIVFDADPLIPKSAACMRQQ